MSVGNARGKVVSGLVLCSHLFRVSRWRNPEVPYLETYHWALDDVEIYPCGSWNASAISNRSPPDRSAYSAPLGQDKAGRILVGFNIQLSVAIRQPTARLRRPRRPLRKPAQEIDAHAAFAAFLMKSCEWSLAIWCTSICWHVWERRCRTARSKMAWWHTAMEKTYTGIRRVKFPCSYLHGNA
jgi:hypothetical protein